MLNVGDPAPDFDLLDHKGNHVKLSDLRGKKVVLWFYPKADTPGCTREGCAFRDLAGDYEKKNARVYGISFDTVEQNRAFAEKFGFSFPLLCDTDRKVGIAYGAADSEKDQYARRIAYVIDENGRIAQAHPKVDASSYPAEQLAAL